MVAWEECAKGNGGERTPTNARFASKSGRASSCQSDAFVEKLASFEAYVAKGVAPSTARPPPRHLPEADFHIGSASQVALGKSTPAALSNLSMEPGSEIATATPAAPPGALVRARYAIATRPSGKAALFPDHTPRSSYAVSGLRIAGSSVQCSKSSDVACAISVNPEAGLCWKKRWNVPST